MLIAVEALDGRDRALHLRYYMVLAVRAFCPIRVVKKKVELQFGTTSSKSPVKSLVGRILRRFLEVLNIRLVAVPY